MDLREPYTMWMSARAIMIALWDMNLDAGESLSQCQTNDADSFQWEHGEYNVPMERETRRGWAQSRMMDRHGDAMGDERRDGLLLIFHKELPTTNNSTPTKQLPCVSISANSSVSRTVCFNNRCRQFACCSLDILLEYNVTKLLGVCKQYIMAYDSL